MTETSTCQICARAIRSKTGLIAHHGYKRPGQGWQTSSCYGAKYRPYEVACDAIEGAIRSCEDFVQRTLVAIEEFPVSPPWVLRQKDAYGKVHYAPTRPEGFDPAAKPSGSYRPGSADHYTHLFHAQLRGWQMAVDHARMDIEFLKARLAAWAPATSSKEG